MRRRRPRELYLEEHVLLAGGQIHLVLVVIHADVDDVGQQLLVAGDHFQLLMETLNSPALRQPLSRTLLTHTPRKARSWAAGRVHLPPPRDHWGDTQPVSSPQRPHGGRSGLLYLSHGRELPPRGSSDG